MTNLRWIWGTVTHLSEEKILVSFKTSAKIKIWIFSHYRLRLVQVYSYFMIQSFININHSGLDNKKSWNWHRIWERDWNTKCLNWNKRWPSHTKMHHVFNWEYELCVKSSFTKLFWIILNIEILREFCIILCKSSPAS